MSYAKFRDMVELCGHLQARSMGLTIAELMQLTERSRKTVERMLGTLIGLGLVEANHARDSDHHLTKRWRLENSTDAAVHLFMNIEPLEKAALERLLNSLEAGPAQIGLTKMLSLQNHYLATWLMILTNLLNEMHILGVWDPKVVFDRELCKFSNLQWWGASKCACAINQN